MNLTWLLERNDGAVFVVSMGWNDTKAEVDQGRLVGLARGMADLLAKEKKCSYLSASEMHPPPVGSDLKDQRARAAGVVRGSNVCIAASSSCCSRTPHQASRSPRSGSRNTRTRREFVSIDTRVQVARFWNRTAVLDHDAGLVLDRDRDVGRGCRTRQSSRAARAEGWSSARYHDRGYRSDPVPLA